MMGAGRDTYTVIVILDGNLVSHLLDQSEVVTYSSIYQHQTLF